MVALKKDNTKDDVSFEYVPIEDLKHDPSNPNIMNEEQMNAVKENIKQFGFIVPVVINDNYEIADGEHRVQIAKELGVKTVPCIKSSRLNDDIARRIARQALNKIRGEHDIEKDVQEIQQILTSQYKGAASILQKVSLIGKSQYEDMKRIITTGGIPNIRGQFETVLTDDGRYYDKTQQPRKAESYLTNQIKQIVMYFTAEQYEKVLTRMVELGKELGAANNTEIFVKLIDFYDRYKSK